MDEINKLHPLCVRHSLLFLVIFQGKHYRNISVEVIFTISKKIIFIKSQYDRNKVKAKMLCTKYEEKISRDMDFMEN